MTYATDRHARAARVAGRRSCGCWSAGWRTSSRRRRSGTWTSGPRSRRPSSRIASCRARTIASGLRASQPRRAAPRRDRDDAAGADSRLRRARRASRRRAVPAAVRAGGGHAAVRRARAGAGASAGRSREGQRHRDDLHLRRHHRRDLVARAGPAGARGDSAGRHAAAGAPGAAPGWESIDAGARAAALRRAGRPVRGEGARARSSSSCASRAISIGEPRPITHAVKFYEKGDRPLEIVTSRQWFIKTIEFREALLARGTRAAVAPAVHAGALRELGRTA